MNLLIEYFVNMYQHLMVWLTSPNSYFQVIWLIFVFGISYLISKHLRKKFPIFHQTTQYYKVYSKQWLLYRAGRLIYPLSVILILAISEGIIQQYIDNLELVHATQRVTMIWISWVLLKAFIKNTIVRSVGLWVLLPSALLHLFNLLAPVINNLNSYGFDLGNIKITPYLFIKSICIVIFMIWIGRILSAMITGYIRRNDSLVPATKELIVKMINIMLLMILFMISLNFLGIDLTAFAVFSGALGVGLGFGLQKIAANFISGLILLVEKSVDINDLVELDDGMMGYVRTMGARATVVETFDGREIMVPNEDFISSRVANLTHNKNTMGRIEIAVGVSYDSDLHQVRDLLLKATEDHKDISTTKPPKCYLREYGDNSINFILTFWLDDIDIGRWYMQSEIMFRIWELFKEHNIEIPFPQRDIHIRSSCLPAIQTNNVS